MIPVSLNEAIYIVDYAVNDIYGEVITPFILFSLKSNSKCFGLRARACVCARARVCVCVCVSDGLCLCVHVCVMLCVHLY